MLHKETGFRIPSRPAGLAMNGRETGVPFFFVPDLQSYIFVVDFFTLLR